MVGPRARRLAARQRGLDRRCEPARLRRLARGLLRVEGGHDLAREELERRADLLVADATALAEEYHLVDARVGVGAEELVQLRRRADGAAVRLDPRALRVGAGERGRRDEEAAL